MPFIVSWKDWQRAWETIGLNLPASKRKADRNPSHETYKQRADILNNAVVLMVESTNSLRIYTKDDAREIVQLMASLDCDRPEYADPEFWERVRTSHCQWQVLPTVTQVEVKKKGKKKPTKVIKIKGVGRCFGNCDDPSHICDHDSDTASGPGIRLCWCHPKSPPRKLSAGREGQAA